MKNRSYAVFGLGRYGRAVAKELVDNGNEVIAVDHNQDLVNEAAADIPLEVGFEGVYLKGHPALAGEQIVPSGIPVFEAHPSL